jgi:cytochrome oxidase Cu insertion factor (SCO1/SenC/PrrC family)
MAMRQRAQTLLRSEIKRVKLRCIPWMIAIAVTIVMGIPHGKAQVASGAVGTAHVGSPAPDFILRLLNGKTVTLSSLKGKPVLLSFWHSG